MTVIEMLKNAKKASYQAALLSEGEKNRVLMAISEQILKDEEAILSENAKDVEKAKATVGSVMIDRLTLNKERISQMAKSVCEVRA